MRAKPFRPLPLDVLPERAARPHGHHTMRSFPLRLDSAPFGRLTIHVRELGAGPPLLLVHGLMTSSYSWRYVVEPLAREFRVIAPDLPGAGRSDKPVDRPYRASALARSIGEIIDALDIGGCAVVGNSLGGYLCMRLALDRPSLMRSLVNIHSPGVPEARLSALHAGLRLPGARALLGAVIARHPERFAQRNVHYYDETLKSREESREYAAPLRTSEGRTAFVRWLAESLAPDELRQLTAELRSRRSEGRGFPLPLRLVYARQDAMVPPRVGVRLRELIPDAELVWLDDSSHFAHVDTPDRVVELVREWARG